MSTDTVLTTSQIERLIRDTVAAKIIQGEDIEPKDWVDFARAIEQAILQSEQVQAWKRDAGLCAEYRKLLEGAAAVLANSAEELEEGAPNECLAHEARSMAQTILLELQNDAAMERDA